jgi:protein-tyrosine kinase
VNLIEQATKRLEELERAGVAVPWAAAAAGQNASQRAGQGPLSQPSNVVASPVVAFRASPSPSPLPSPERITAPDERVPKQCIDLDLDRLRGAGYLVPDQIRSELAEQLRHLKRPLLKTARASVESKRPNAGQIMVTSALPGEGKTFCSINLAMSMAMEVDTAVILVDADVVRPSVFDRLGVKNAPVGMLDYLSGSTSDLADILVGTNVPKLLLLPAGQANSRSTELLASAAMDRLIAQLADEYPDHIVIFDAPPLLLTTESAALASKAGQVLVVVESGKTTRQIIQRTFAALRNCPVVVSVLNKCDEPTDGLRYGYYYG